MLKNFFSRKHYSSKFSKKSTPRRKRLLGFRHYKKIHNMASVRRRKLWGQRAKISLKWFIILIMVISVSGTLFFAIRQMQKNNKQSVIVNKIKTWFDFSGQSAPLQITKLTVQGLPYKLPIIPKSTFAFKNVLQNPPKINVKDEDLRAVYQFLSSNQSVYLLPLDYTFSNAIDFYKSKLADLGWEYVAYYDPGSRDQVAGAYWINAEKKRGLHLSEVSNDVWYELITIKEAQNGLKGRIEAYKLQQFTVRTMAGNKVPEVTGWSFYYSGEWKMHFNKNKFFDVYNINLEDQEKIATIKLIPIGRIYKPLVDLEYQDIVQEAEKYFQKINKTILDKENKPIFVTKKLLINQQKAIEYRSILPSRMTERNRLLFIVHKKQQIIYLLEISNTATLEYYQYLQKNLQEIL